MAFTPLTVPSIEEGSSLLRSYALDKIREHSEALVFHYESHPHRESQDASNNASNNNSEVDVQPEKTGMVAKLANGQLQLYDHSSPQRIIPLYLPPTVGAVPDKIIVIDLVGCIIDDARKFINAASTTIHNPQAKKLALASQNLAGPAFPDVLSSPNLDLIDSAFITGISLCGAFKPETYLTLFVSIPYLGTGTIITPSGSRTLKQYRLREQLDDPMQSIEYQVLVHQTWFLVFDNRTIGVFRSGDDINSKRVPLFAYQQRGGAFQALVHMISNSLTSSEDKVLEHFREKAIKFELNQSSETRHDAESDSDAEVRDNILQVLTMMKVITLQTKYLEYLRQIFLNSYPELDHIPQWNEFDIPFMSGHTEQMRAVMKSITAIVSEREKFYKELKNLAKEFETLRTLFQQRDQVKSQTIVQESLEKQGQTITVFTFVTSIFMPLGFLTGYYGMNPPGFETSITTPEQFWSYAAPITASILTILVIFLFRPDSKIKGWVVKKWEDHKNP